MAGETQKSVSPEKVAKVAEVKERFDKAVSSVLVDFRGIDVGLITELREKFREKGVEYKVVKNTLVSKAIAGTELENTLGEHLKGPTAIAWSYEDPSAAAKVIKEFRKGGDEQEKLTVKCGVLDTEVLDASRVETELASLPGKDELRAMLLAQLMAPAQNLVRQLQAPSHNMALVIEAYRRKLSGEE